MRGALDVHRELLARGIPHEMVRLRRPALAADDLPGTLDLPATSCVAVRCYVADGALVAAVVHAGDVPDPAALLDAVGARALRAAAAHEVNAATDTAAGLVSPVGLPGDVVLLVDAAVAGTEVVYAPTGEAGVALGIRTADLLAAVPSRVVGLCGRPATGPAGALAGRDPADWPRWDGAGWDWTGWDVAVTAADVRELDRQAAARRSRRPVG